MSRAYEMTSDTGMLPRDEARGQRLALHVLHDDEVDAVFVADVVQGADVRVIEGGDRERFALKPGARLRVIEPGGRQDFDRDNAIQPRVARFIHLAHAT